MRLWSLHPRYLDVKGLLALWREALLAQNVLLDKTSAYKNHPQLERFKSTSNSVGTIATYLRSVAEEADCRGYHFDKSKIVRKYYRSQIVVSSGQLAFEVQHLLSKLRQRDITRYNVLRESKSVNLHPLFKKSKGPVADWERVNN
ncbi:MAG: pyrimidine dimer DNA glycosylase/endonuclease V [Gammaproteobacteria bacterium]|nr:pyrimidine dimer DNA glycosylase/endonuclease V [Gammaproteobacteria bacterium]